MVCAWNPFIPVRDMATETVRRRIWTAACVVAGVLACGLAHAGPAGAQGDAMAYTVEAGDTLLSIATRYMDRPESWHVLQRINRVPDPYRLVPGSKILIPFSRIPETAGAAVVVHTIGDVRAAGKPVEVGTRLVDADRIETGAGASVTVELADRTRITLPPQTVVQVQRVRSFARALLIDAVFSVEKGAAAARVAPAGSGVGRFEIRTPLMVTGVRGTRYRVSADATSARSEVLEGHVAVGAGVLSAAATTVDAGYGVGAGLRGVLSKPVRLLGAPALETVPALVLGNSIRLSWSPVAGAVRYLLTVSRDADLTEIVWMGSTAALQESIGELPEGPVYLSVSAIASTGLVGIASTAPLQVRINPPAPLLLEPAAEHTQYGDAAHFEWATVPKISRYEIEVAQDAGFELGRVRWTTTEVETSRPLVPGRWWWRVRSVDTADLAGPWSDAVAFQMEPAGPVPRADDDGSVLRISWPKGAAASAAAYRVQLARDEAFSSMVVDAQVATNQMQMPRPQAGVYYVRVALLPAQGVLHAAAFSAPQRLLLDELLRDGSGQAIGGGESGGPKKVRVDRAE